MRAARRGAFAAAVIFGSLVAIAAVITPPLTGDVPRLDPQASAWFALFSLPGLALLGAGLTSAALGSRLSAASAGLAIGIGSPVAAVTSVMIGAFIVVGLFSGASRGGDVAGTLLRAGVTAAVRIWPLIAIASAGWVLIVRRFGPAVRLPSGEASRVDPPAADSHLDDPPAG
ncbi:MAG TPA: hypothetical protein VGQ31_03290 [Candidatus Limnocylindrales bacterium]|nr:hypothetical protein [Candidatus Limnocylindrales bacterium]